MNEDLVGFLIKNLLNAIVVAFILSWVVSFLLKKDVYFEMRRRIRIVFSIIIFIALFFIEIPPTKLDTKEIMREWYPKASKITVITIEKSKTALYTYDAYVSWLYDNKNCNGIVNISKEKKTSEYWTYDLNDESIKCTKF